MAKGATSKSKTKNEENRKREEEQQRQQANQKRAESNPQRTQTAENKPTTQEAAPKPTSTQIPTLEPKYASPEQIEEARDFGRRSLEMARAGQLDMSEKIPFTQGVRGYADQYRIPELEDYQANYDTSSDVYRAPAGDDSSRRPANAPYADKTWLKSRRGNAEEGAVPILGSRRGYAETPAEENYDPSRLSARDQRRLRSIDKDIERLSGRYNNPEIQRRLEGLQAERDRITGQHLMSDDTDMSELIDTWLDNDYEMSDTEIEQAKQIIRDYENNEYKNSNVYDLTDEESAKLSQINALRDKVSKPEAAVYGTMNATPGVSALMAAGDNDFYGWSLDQLRDEVARQRDIPMSAETRDYVNQLQQRIASYQDLMQNPDTIYSTGDVGVDDISGANTPFKNSAEVQRAINETETQMYKLMLESMRGDQSDYDKYSFRKANAQKQNPLQYNTADLLTRGLESAAIQGAMGSNGLLADIATDMLTDTGAEYIANKAGGMSNVDASNRAFGSAIGNIGLDVGINAAPGIINGLVERRLQRLRDQIPTIEDDVIEAALRQTDEVPTVEAPTQAARQAEPEVPTVEAPAQPAEQTVETSPDNVVYHSGTLSRNNKAETRGMMSDGMRNTGYYGTGHYFVDAAHKGELDNFKNYNSKPYSSVDISKYNNLYRADTDAKASELHSFSEDFMRYVNRYNDSKYYTDADGNIDPVAKAEYIDDLYDKFRRLFPEQDVSRGSFEDILDSYRNSHVDVDLNDLGDSEFTQFMKSMGYNGVDTRGTRSADTSRGVVIYDLDEDSILQSNVNDAEVKRGPMNRRVRNEGESVFDAAEDERIQRKLDAQRRDAEIDEEYHRIYDTSQLDEARSRIDALEKELTSAENSAEYSRRLLEDEDFLDEEVKRSVRELSQFDIEVSPEAEKALRIETATQDVEEANAALDDIRRRLNEAQANYDEQEALSFEAYEQARRNIEGVEAEEVDDVANAMEELADDSVNVHDYGTGERKVESHRANTMNKSQYTTEQNSPTENYEYNVWGREAQTEMGHQRWDDNPNAIGELANKEYWDAADARFAHDRWTELMEKGDPESIRQAGRLSRKQSYEMREGGRLIQTNVDAEADTVAGQFNQARQLINKAVDTHRGAGTSEALDNFITQLENRLQKEGLLDYNLQFFGEGKERRIQIIQEMLDEGMGAYAPTNKNIGSRDFSGVNKILSQLESGKINDMESLTKAIYRQNGGANISAENQKKIFDYLTEASKLQEGTREQEVLLAKAARLAMQDVPVSLGKKIRSILYTNMLGNFKTAVSRNAIGNAAYNLLEQTRHPLAAGVDALTSLATGKRSTLGWNLDKFKAYGRGFAKGASDQAKDIAQRVDTGRNGSMGWVNALKENSTIWRENTDNKVRNALGKLANNATFYVTNAMEMGDRPFFEANFEQRRVELQQLLERYGKQGVAGFDKIPDEAIDDTINMMAAIHAADAVFQKQGHMSMGLSKMREGLADLSRGYIGFDLLSTSATPFTMTPGNMLEKAIEYSPLGAIKNTARTIGELSTGKFNQRRFVDEASRNLMSIPMLGGAYAVAKRGGINGGYSEDPDEKSAQMSDDFIEYGLNVPDAVPLLGGKTLNTADIPVLASILQTAGAINEKGLNADSLKQAAEAILLGSTMQGFRRLFGSDTAYNSSLSDSFINTVASAGNQLIPSLVRQTAQTTDEYKRDLGEYGTGQYYLNQIKNSTPGWRETLPIKYDTEGNPVLQNQGRGIGSKIAENYILPMQVSEYSPSELNQEAQRLKDATDNAAGFVPYAKRSDLRDWDASLETPIEYTEEQFYDYKRDLGKLNSDTATRVIRSELYHSLSDEDKVSALADVYSAMKQVAKYNATEIGTDNKLANAYMDDGIDGFMERLEAKYNQYGLDPDVYIEMKTNGEDMTPFEGYKEAQEAVGIGDSAGARKFWLDGQATGQGPESLQDYKDYSDALKEYDMSASDKAWAAFEANGADGIAALKEQRDTAFDTGFVSSDGKVNTQAYEKAVSVLGDNPDVLDGYTSFKSDITEKGYTTQEQYIPYVQNLSGLSNEQKGQYIMLYAGKTPTEDSLGKNAWAAYDSAGYNGYYLYKSLQEVKDYNGDDKKNKYDRIQQLYDWGYDQTTDMYQLLVDLKY